VLVEGRLLCGHKLHNCGWFCWTGCLTPIPLWWIGREVCVTARTSPSLQQGNTKCSYAPCQDKTAHAMQRQRTGAAHRGCHQFTHGSCSFICTFRRVTILECRKGTCARCVIEVFAGPFCESHNAKIPELRLLRPHGQPIPATRDSRRPSGTSAEWRATWFVYLVVTYDYDTVHVVILKAAPLADAMESASVQAKQHF